MDVFKAVIIIVAMLAICIFLRSHSRMRKGLTFIHYADAGCPYSQALEPLWAKLKKTWEYDGSGVSFIRLDYTKGKNIQYTPTIHALYNNDVVQYEGAIAYSLLDKFIGNMVSQYSPNTKPSVYIPTYEEQRKWCQTESSDMGPQC